MPGVGELGGRSTESGSGGEFVLTGVGVGPLFVRARAPGYVAGQASGVAPPADDVEISLLPAGVIEGRVRAGDGFVSQLTAALTRRGPDPAGAALDAGFWTQTRSFLGPDGVFRFDDVPPGRYDLTVASPGFAPSEVVGIVLGAGERRAVAVSLGAGASLAGVVRDATTGAAVVGAMARLDTGSVNQLAHSDSQGRFRIDDIAPGRRSLTVRHPAYVSRIETGLALVAATHAEVALTLEPVPFGSDETIEFAGIGAVLAMDGELLRVRGVLPRGPAALAGLVDDDAVVAIDGEPTGGRSFGDNIEAVRGVAGTVVRLEVLRGDEQRTFDVVRATVRFRPEEPEQPGGGDASAGGDDEPE
ncbi:MAG: hypothetical protein Tsb0020_43790 [Haliangiales bacterium]